MPGTKASWWRKQDPRVHDPGGVKFSLRPAKLVGEQLRHLAQVPAAVITPDGVVMGDRAAERRDRLRSRDLDLIPLFQLLAGTARSEDGVIRRRAVGVHVRETTRDNAAATCLAHRLPRGRQHPLVEFPETIPGDGRLEGLADYPEPDQTVAQVSTAQERGPPDRGRVAFPAAYLAPMAGADLQRPCQPRLKL